MSTFDNGIDRARRSVERWRQHETDAHAAAAQVDCVAVAISRWSPLSIPTRLTTHTCIVSPRLPTSSGHPLATLSSTSHFPTLL